MQTLTDTLPLGAPKPLLILGTHLLALELIDLISDIAEFEVVGLVENLDRERCTAPIKGLPVHWIDDIAPLAATHWVVCGISTTHRAGFIQQAVELGFRFATLVHPSSRVSAQSTLGEGVIVSPGCLIASHTQIGRYVFVNRGVMIGHHTVIEEYATIQPGANIAGVCHIGEGAYIGMSSVVIDHTKVGAGSIVGAGAVVTKDVPANVQVVGIPAKINKENVPGK
jgi:sugar O-acyltransferase (sialic acid O-acetyltransferase NeuD family)